MKQKLLYTDWYARFRCVGGSCPLTCCGGWRISLLEKEVEMYRGMEQPCAAAIWDAVDEEKKEMKQCGGRCKLLTEEKLCTIVLECGEEYLSATCKIFPRTIKTFGDIQEANVEIVCPIVARYLFEEEPLSFGLEEVEADVSGTVDYVLYDALNAARTYLVGLFQIPDAAGDAIGGKIYLMLKMAEELRALYGAGELTPEAVRRCVDSYDREEVYGAWYPFCEKIIGNMDIKAGALQLLVAELSQIGIFQKELYVLERELPDIRQLIEERQKLDSGDRNRVLRQFVAYVREHFGTFSSNFFVYSLFNDWLPEELDMEKFGMKIRLRVLELALIQYFAMMLWMKDGELTADTYALLISIVDRYWSHGNKENKENIAGILEKFLENEEEESATKLLLFPAV